MSKLSSSDVVAWGVLLLILFAWCPDSDKEDAEYTGEVQQGDLSMTGGTPTVRKEYDRQADDPFTTDDEGNDQPVGHFGTLTLLVTGESGNMYTIDGELDGLELRRLYFPRGGWVDFWDCELEEELTGTCFDEEGRSWDIQGEGLAGRSTWVTEGSGGNYGRDEDDESFDDDLFEDDPLNDDLFEDDVSDDEPLEEDLSGEPLDDDYPG